jgi:hypothetical protein
MTAGLFAKGVFAFAPRRCECVEHRQERPEHREERALHR